MRTSISQAGQGRLLPWVACVVLSFSPTAFAGQLTFTGDVAFYSPLTNQATFPSTSGAGTLKIFGINPGGPVLQNTVDGFRWTNVDIQYTSAAADVGKQFSIDWVVSRAMKYTAGMYTTTTSMTGSVVVPAGGTIASIHASTDFDSIAGNSVSMVKLGPYNANANFNSTNTTKAFNAAANNSDYLLQAVVITLTSSAANQVFNVYLPNSEVGAAAAVPEPTSLVLVASALPGLVWLSRRRRRQRLHITSR